MSAYRIRPLFLVVSITLLIAACKTHDRVVPQPVPSGPCAPKVMGGFTDKISYFPGDDIIVFLQANDTARGCQLDVYDIKGNVAFSIPTALQKQTNPDTTYAGYKFEPTVHAKIPEALASGIYQIEKIVPFVVKTKDPVDLTLVYPINTANAYCNSGGRSLYSTVDRPGSVSYLRPIPIQTNCTACLSWFPEQTDIRVGYVSDIDLDDFSSIKNSKVVVILGHSEYWTRKARENFDLFVDHGGDALILSGNTMWWQVRYSPDKTKLICFKDARLDSISNPLMETINWTQPQLQYPVLPSIGADFPHGGYGLQNDRGWDGYKITAPTSPLLEGTNFKQGDTLHLPSGEYDGSPISGFDANGFPIIDNGQLHFEKIELIGFDKGTRGGQETIGTCIIFKKTKTSGVVFNAASYDWCSPKGMGGRSGDAVKKITRNAIDLMIHNRPLFSK